MNLFRENTHCFRYIDCVIRTSVLIILIFFITLFVLGHALVLITPKANEQEMFDKSDIYVVHSMQKYEHIDRSLYILQDYNRKLFGGNWFILETGSEKLKKFEFYVIAGQLVLVENNKLNLLLAGRGID
ncbi:MAG: hypothetical protein UZ19_OD1000068 [Parcubacteria bacterium OLB19]|nr:MAG: hypothetical protein UZ19_OD1000068 [Parcubacteria bacterium OLB19]